MDILNSDQRRHLDAAIQRARTASEQAAGDAVNALAVADASRPAYLSDEDNALRLALREKARQLGDDMARSGEGLTNLIREVAYEQWHRLLFARFLEANGLLRHPEFRDTSLTLADCADLSHDLGEPDGWSVAARFASEILPGVFRLEDPAVRIRFATEHRLELEQILLSLPVDVFIAEDALGWVYQFWQTAEKKRVNDSGVKIGGADLSPVTQLFTENYMVRFLLENSLGAWWAARHPDSPLIDSWEYLRRLDDGTPAAGTFAEWPVTAAEVTVVDPCCGSGHFLVAMFGMLWRMRAEEEGLSSSAAQDAVLRENLHGVELDPRCTQIATFNVALEAWKQGGFRELPAPQIACSGVPVRAFRAEWEALAGADDELRKVMARFHSLFRNADSLGSLIDPRPSGNDDGLFGRDLSIGVSGDRARALLVNALRNEHHESTVLGHAADDVIHAAGLLGRTFTLVATNPPYLGANKHSDALLTHSQGSGGRGLLDLAYLMKERWQPGNGSSSTLAIVLPSEWMVGPRSSEMRRRWLQRDRPLLLARLGYKAFQGGLRVNPVLQIEGGSASDSLLNFLDLPENADTPEKKRHEIATGGITRLNVEEILISADAVISTVTAHGAPLGNIAECRWGLGAGDGQRFQRLFWEVPSWGGTWEFLQSSTPDSEPFSGRSHIVLWENESGALARLAESVKHLNHKAQQWRSGKPFWGRQGVAVNRVGQLRVSAYLGDRFSTDCLVLVPKSERDLGALWAFARSGELERLIRAVDRTLSITPRSVLNVPFDVERWRQVAAGLQLSGLPEPSSCDPTQWLFKGTVSGSTQPLQVALARLLGFRWSDQQPDDLDRFVDLDGIAALQSLPGEPDLATRLRELLAVAYGARWSSSLERSLVAEAGGKNGRLEEWLRDNFFAQHTKVFGQRPFLWHIWDGRKDGFSAVVNYHRLDHRTLEKLTFTSLGAWIERQKHEVRASRAGADTRLAAAENLQERLKAILEGDPPYDMYVRWKQLHEQPIGWNPDLDDGVRLNIRPFVAAGVLRSKVNVHWKLDRGTNLDGSERVNDLHPALDERRDARLLAGEQP